MSVIPLRVAIRARPLIPKEVDEGCQTCLTFVPGEPQIVLGKNRSFTYDYVFSSTDPQIIVYEDAVKPIVKTIFKGYNATVLAYGQTGSGKTFTMGGGYEASLKMDPEGMGVIPRILQEVFNGMKDRHENYEYKIFVSYLEIINEELHDLLVNGKNSALTIREENGEIKIPGLKEIETKDAEDTMRCLEQGCSNRTTAATAMNSTSSRSHAIFTVYIEQKHREDTNDFWRAKLQLVDLAGSERVKKTHAEGERLKEGININKGLLSLGNVISALGDETQKKLHIPYRDSKLTRILQDSLGGNSHTLMIACVSPADSNMEETLNTMRYADRARKIKNKPVVNWDPQTAEIMRLKEVVQQLTMKMIHHGLTDITTSSTTSSTPTTSPKQTNNAVAIRSWMDKCKALEDENNSLSKELRHSVDQTASVCEKAIKWEMKCDRLTSRLQVINENVGVDFDLLSATMTAESNPLIAEQLEKLKAFASNINESVETEETENNSALEEEEEDDNKDENDEMETSTPESREIVKQHTLRRAKMNTELEELNKILEKKEKLASQMCQNDNKMQAMRDQYENTMKLLEDEVSGLQKEKENLSSALEDARTNTAASKVSEQRRKRLQELETQICDLRKKMVEQKKVLKLKEQSDKQVSKLNTEIQALKQQRVRLMKQMKEDGDTWRKFRQQKDKEVLQLQQKDRKRQFEIQKLQRENQRTQTVLHRKAEEAAAANRRLKEALAKQKKVLEERNQKFEKCDNTTIGNRVRKWLSHEMDVRVGIHEAKYHRESLLQDRKTMAEDLKTLKESLDDDGPPSKRMAWMDDSGQKCEASFKEEDTKKKITEVQQQIELRNVQIADLQQKIFDAEQECRGKSAKDNMHTMMEAKISIKWLLDQAVSYKADNNRLRLEIQDLRENIEESGTDNNRYIDDLEHDNDELKRTHQSTIIKLRHEHQKEIEILLASAQQITTTDPDMQRRLDVQKDEIKKLNELNEQLRKKTEQCDTMEKHLTKYMYKDKSVALMPDLTDDDDQPPEARSPFLNMRPKPKRPAPKGGKKKLQMEEYVCEGEDMVEEEIAYNDPTWTPISKGNRAEGPHTRMSRRRKTDLFKQPEIGKTDNINNLPNIDDNDNRTPDNTATSSVLNTTFEVEPSVSSEEGQIPDVSDKITTKPPLRMRKQHSRVGRPALEIIQTDNIRSSDEFEKPMRKSASASNLRKKSSSSSLRKKSSTGNLRKKSSSSDLSTTSLGDETSVLLEGLQKKKRKLHNTKDSFFSPPE